MDTQAADNAPYQHGHMDVTAHIATFKSVKGLFKWGSLWTAAVIALLVLWFCTPAGLLTGLVVAAVMIGLGSVFLRSEPPTTH
jgi:hypothetical protein